MIQQAGIMLKAYVVRPSFRPTSSSGDPPCSDAAASSIPKQSAGRDGDGPGLVSAVLVRDLAQALRHQGARWSSTHDLLHASLTCAE